MAECVQPIETEVPSHAPSPALLKELEETCGDGLSSPGHTFFAASPPSRVATPGLIQPTSCASAAEHPALDVVLGPFAVKETCVVLDWDDTLFPSSFVDRKKLIHARGLDDLPVELQRGFAELEKAATRLVTTAVGFGTVLIITNAQTGWVELCVSKFMPDMMAVLDASVRVVSARSSFERYFPGDPLCWKAAAFAHELHQLQKSLGTPLKNILSFGDSMEERTAVKIAAGQLQSRAKSIKFLDAPSPRQLHQQIEVVTDCLEWIWRHNGDLDVVLTLEQEQQQQQQQQQQYHHLGESQQSPLSQHQPQPRPISTLTPLSVATPSIEVLEKTAKRESTDRPAIKGSFEGNKTIAMPVVVTPLGSDKGEAGALPEAMHVVTDEEESEEEN
ncbi:protein kinase [Nannochloropsis oceanica]